MSHINSKDPKGLSYLRCKSPLGELILAADDHHLRLCHRSFELLRHFDFIDKETPLLRLAKMQLQQYFQKQRKTFEVPLLAQGTPFQEKSWKCLQSIPYGGVTSYSDIAHALKTQAYRAVGGALNKNPLLIFYPCHRVLGKSGLLRGYAAGLGSQKLLIDLEAKGDKLSSFQGGNDEDFSI